MAFRIPIFDTWTAGVAGSTVRIELAGTSTLASVYTDEALSVAASNPQTLSSRTVNGVAYGKFAAPLYVGVDVELKIDDSYESGVLRMPVTTLDAEDASLATVQAAGGSQDIQLEDIVARIVHVEDFGVFLPTSDVSYSASTNAATLAAAIGRAVTLGGGEVWIPGGTYMITTVSVSAAVLIRGRGRDVTIIQSTQGSTVATLAGNKAGFADLTLDGVSKQAGSIGIYSKAKAEQRMHDVCVKRFETGIHQKGAQRNDFRDLYINNCVTGMKGHGDDDAGNGADGEDFWLNHWAGGLVSECTTTGVELSYEDRICWHNSFSDVGFEDNTGTALKINGARYTNLNDKCWFDGNTTDLVIQDDTATVLDQSNKVVGFKMTGGQIDGAMTISGLCQDVVFDGVAFESGTYTLNAPENAVLTIDCIEDSTVTLAGTDTTKWVRCRKQLADYPNSFGLTTGNTATDAWTYNLAPGERVHVEAVVIANGRNVNDYAIYHIARAAHRPVSTLNYDGQTGNFTAGLVVTGTTSGATARIAADSDSGATGTLSLRDINGTFQDNETITDTSTGSASVNGTITNNNAALLGSTTSIETAVESDANFACDFAVSGDEVKIQVTGATSKTVEWTVSAKVTSG